MPMLGEHVRAVCLLCMCVHRHMCALYTYVHTCEHVHALCAHRFECILYVCAHGCICTLHMCVHM